MTMKIIELLLEKPSLFSWTREELALLQGYSAEEMEVILHSAGEAVQAPRAWY